MHEIITLQLGQRSNYLATHFWNLQESYFTYNAAEQEPLVLHDVHFRQGLGTGGVETYTPRTLIYDLKGGFGTMKKFNELYGDDEEYIDDENAKAKALWNGAPVVHKQPQIPQHEYQRDLNLGASPPRPKADTIRYWSDFNRLYYHPRSIVQINDYELKSTMMPFEQWDSGDELFRRLDHELDILDRDFRPFAEECDQLRGVQIFAGVDDAWGGFLARYVDELRDEYGKTAIWVWGAEDGGEHQFHKRNLLSTNTARTIAEVSPQTTAYIPVVDPPRNLPLSVHLETGSEWYTSALLAQALESISLPTRLRSCLGFNQWLGELDKPQKILSLKANITAASDDDSEKSSLGDDSIANKGEDLVFEDEVQQDEQLQEGYNIDFSQDPRLQQDLSRSGKRNHVFSQARVYRGYHQDQQHQQNQSPSAYSEYTLDSGTNLQLYNTSLAFPKLDCFPGDLIRGSHNQAAADDDSIRIRSALSATSDIGDRLKQLQRFAARGVAVGERESLVNGLAEIGQHYQYSFEEDFDESGDDD